MASNDIGDWYRGIPQMTKYWFTGSIVVPLVARLGLINPVHLILIFERVAYNFQVIFCEYLIFLNSETFILFICCKIYEALFCHLNSEVTKKKKELVSG